MLLFDFKMKTFGKRPFLQPADGYRERMRLKHPGPAGKAPPYHLPSLERGWSQGPGSHLPRGQQEQCHLPVT
jgi:hypothetical protein